VNEEQYAKVMGALRANDKEHESYNRRLHEHDEAIKELQENLIKLGFDCGSWGADGDFGGETEKALKAFQKAAGLPETGVYDAATGKALKEKVLGTVEITGGSVNVRSGPGTSNRDIGTVHRGDQLVYQGEVRAVDGRDWYLVEFDNRNGWVSSKYAVLVE